MLAYLSNLLICFLSLNIALLILVWTIFEWLHANQNACCFCSNGLVILSEEVLKWRFCCGHRGSWVYQFGMDKVGPRRSMLGSPHYRNFIASSVLSLFIADKKKREKGKPKSVACSVLACALIKFWYSLLAFVFSCRWDAWLKNFVLKPK